MEPAENVAAQIAELIRKLPSKTVAGSRLSAWVGLTFPEFSPAQYSCANLRDFIRTHASSVSEIGRTGEDIIYGLHGAQIAEGPEVHKTNEQPLSPQDKEPRISVDTTIWKTFSSPQAPYKLFGHPESGFLQVVAPGAPSPGVPWVNIPSCSPETNLQIAKDFISNLENESHRQLLTQILGIPRWWIPFFINAKNVGLAREWISFRRKRIILEFQESLKSHGIPLGRYSRGVIRGQRLARPSLARALPAAPASKVSLLRRVASGAVERMSSEELRALSLPLGHVLDELERG